MPTKVATTSLQQHFQLEFVNEAIRTYTKVPLAGGETQFHLLIRLPPPPQFQIWEPDKNGIPRRWHKPWAKPGAKTSTTHQVNDQDE